MHSKVGSKRPVTPGSSSREAGPTKSKIAAGDTVKQVPAAKTLLALYYVFGGSTEVKGGSSSIADFEKSYEALKANYETSTFTDLNFAKDVQALLAERLEGSDQALVMPILQKLQSGDLSYLDARTLLIDVLEHLLAYRGELPKAVLDDRHGVKGAVLRSLPRALNTLAKDGKGNPVDLEGKICKRHKRYLKAMKGRSGAQKALYKTHKHELGKQAWDMKVYSNLDPQSAMKVAMTRDVQNIEMQRPYAKANRNLISCDGSLMTSNEPLREAARKPGNQVCLAMRSVVKVGSEVVRPLILSVPAPALDSPRQPEWEMYVDPKSGDFKKDAFRQSMQAIAQHILACARDNPGHRVVLSGYGLTNFIKALPDASRKRAVEIGAEVMTELLKAAGSEKINCAYMAGSEDDAPWNTIQPRPECLGRFPGKDSVKSWLRDEDIVVNAWDPHSLVGNGCEHDNSLDGYIGRMCLAHEAHALACNIYHQLAKALSVPETGQAAGRIAAKGVSLGAILNQFAGLGGGQSTSTLDAVAGKTTTTSTAATTSTVTTTTTTTDTTASTLITPSNLV